MAALACSINIAGVITSGELPLMVEVDLEGVLLGGGEERWPLVEIVPLACGGGEVSIVAVFAFLCGADSLDTAYVSTEPCRREGRSEYTPAIFAYVAGASSFRSDMECKCPPQLVRRLLYRLLCVGSKNLDFFLGDRVAEGSVRADTELDAR